VFKVMNYEFERLKDSKYLGILAMNSNQIIAEISHRIGIANRR
jgi:hypothetical protein